MADTTTKVLEVVVDNNKAITSISEYNRLIDEQKRHQKELAEQMKEGSLSEADYYKAVAKSKEEVKAYSRSVQELSKEVQNNIKDAQEQEGSLRGLRAQLSNLTKEFDALSRAERNGEAGRAKMDEINRITNELKQAEEETQRFYRNVGNYPDVKPLEQQLGDIKKQLAQLKYEGKDNTEEFQALAEKAGNMKDALADVEQQINATASDTKNLDTAVMGLSTVMGGITLLGPMFASDSEEGKKLADILQKLQAVMLVLNTLRTIQNNTQKQGLLYQTAEKVQLAAVNTLKKVQTALTVKQTAATAAQTVAQRVLNAVMKANPVLLLVGAFTALASIVAVTAKAFTSSSGEVKKQQDALKAAEKALKDYTRGFENQIKLLEELGTSSTQILETRLIGLQEIASKTLEVAQRIYDIEAGTWAIFSDWDRVEEAFNKVTDANRALTDEIDNAVIMVKAWAKEGELLSLGLTEQHLTEIALMEELESKYRIMNRLAESGRISSEEYTFALRAAAGEFEKRLQEESKKRAATARRSAQESARIKKETYRKELELARQAIDAEIALMTKGTLQTRKQEEERHARAIADLQYRLNTEKLTAKQKEAINKLIELEEKKHQQNMEDIEHAFLQDSYKAEMEYLDREIALAAEGSEELLKLKIERLEEERDLELSNLELTEEAKDQIRAVYAKKEADLRKEYNNKALQDAQDLVAKEWENKINEAANKGQQTLQMEIDAAKARMDALHQLEGESDADFKARQLAAEREYIDAKKALDDYELEIEQAKYDALAGMVGGLSQIMEAFGEENEELAKAGKILALAEIAINAGKAIAAGVAQAQTVGFPANIAAVGTTVATVLTNIATAISTVKSAKFATGGLVTGPGSSTSDSIPAQLSNGESVMNARTTSMFGPLLSSLNQAGGGVAFNPGLGGQREGYEFLAAAVAAGMKRVNLRVGVDEVTRVQDRVTHIREISTIE